MRPLLLALSVLLAGGCTMGTPSEPEAQQQPAPVRADHLTLGVSAYYGDDPAVVLQPLVRYLQAELGIQVSLRVAETYVELPALLERGEVDVAQLAPLSYVHLRRRIDGLQPIATPIIGGSPTYLGHIYVREDSPLRTLADLRGHSMAYVSPDSSSGYLFPRELLRRRGFDPDAYFSSQVFLGTHPQVRDAVKAGRVDAGAVFDDSSDWTGPQQRHQGLRVVAKTERIPNDCIVARTGYDPGAVAALRRALVALRPGADGAEEILSLLEVNGWVPADDSRYDRIEAVLEKEAMTTVPSGAAIR